MISMLKEFLQKNGFTVEPHRNMHHARESIKVTDSTGRSYRLDLHLLKEPSYNPLKTKLLKLATDGFCPPDTVSDFGNALENFTNSQSTSFDPSFTEVIKAIRPDWFHKETED